VKFSPVSRRTADDGSIPRKRRGLTFPALLNRDRIIKGTAVAVSIPTTGQLELPETYGSAPLHSDAVTQTAGN